MNLYENRRTALEQLVQEFTSAAAPLFHQRLSGVPEQHLTREVWSDFRVENRAKKGEWQKFVPHPSGLVCSRFYGTGDKAALDTFRRLADTGLALLNAAALDPSEIWQFDRSIVEQIESDPNDNTYLYWLEALHLTAKRCRTLYLHVSTGNWAYTLGPGETVEQAASILSQPTDFLMAFPIHPIMESLQHDVFRSSAEAIKVWLAADDVTPVGDWPARPPIYLPSTTHQAVLEGSEIRETVEQLPDLNEMEENILHALGDEMKSADPLSKDAGYPNNSNFRKTLGSLVRRGLLGNKRGKGYFRINPPQ
jgi:hypothetical protein